MNHHIAPVHLSILICLILPSPAAPARAASPFEGYLDQEALTEHLQELAEAHERCTLDRIGESGQGTPIHLLTLAPDPQEASGQPAVLIVAGLDGRHLVGTEIALRVARHLLEDDPQTLETSTVYIIPRANPDAAAMNFSETITGQIGTFRPIDDDHDAQSDEDGPVDLNGDGFITMMRRANPPLDQPATHLADPVEPRLLKKAEAAKGEHAVYAIHPEGLDQDGDGEIAEDGPGAVDLDRNFMRHWPEHAKDAGPYQLSEPESEAIATFVLEHPEIVAAIVYGRHDNIVKVTDEEGQDVTGRAPKNLHPDDVSYYQEIAGTYRELTAQKKPASSDPAGSLHAWLYGHRGIPTFAGTIWDRPEPSAPPDDDGSEATSEASNEEEDANAGNDRSIGDDDAARSGDASGEGGGATDEERPGTREAAPASQEDEELAEEAQPSTDEEIDEQDERPGERDERDAKPSDEEAAAWLKYSDEMRSGAGFVEWEAFEHPTLGPVEIGGFVPGFRMNPPAAELDELGEKQASFVKEVLQRRPRLTHEGPEVKRLADGLYELRFGIVNEGYLPTTTAMARQARTVPPTIIRLSTPEENVVSGERVVQIWGIEGSGVRSAHHWIIRGDPGSEGTLELINRQLGDQTIEFELEE